MGFERNTIVSIIYTTTRSLQFFFIKFSNQYEFQRYLLNVENFFFKLKTAICIEFLLILTTQFKSL
jgi:hypothetical protein